VQDPHHVIRTVRIWPPLKMNESLENTRKSVSQVAGFNPIVRILRLLLPIYRACRTGNS
jgi:hypothetical protein